MKPQKIKVSLTLDRDIVEIAKRLAKEDERSLSQYINIALKQCFRGDGNQSDEVMKP